MISKIKGLFKSEERATAVASTVILTEISEEQQEAMKGGFPWPWPFPPGGGGGGGFNGGNGNNGKGGGHGGSGNE